MGEPPQKPRSTARLHSYLAAASRRAAAGQIERVPSLVLGVEGKKISPSSFEVLPTLKFVQSFLALMAALADSKKKTLNLTGLKIVPGSTAFKLQADEAETPVICDWAEESAALLMMKNIPAHFRPRVRDAREAISHLPANHHPFFEIKNERRSIPAEFPAPDVYRETTIFRARIELAGGRNPYVRLSTEDKSVSLFNFKTKQALAQEAGRHLYQWIDAVVHLTWEGSSLQEAELDDFVVVPDLEPEDEIKHWEGWFSRIGKHWEEVDDIEDELDCEDDQ